ncbi:hypothetical protein Q3G72_022786 [Acer saccharum]|nr:hypothetical protein Q3G72_022786 [Acer saccharum]
MRNRIFKDSLKARGECSSNQDIRVQNESRLDLCVDLGLVEVSSSKVLHHNLLKPILEGDEEPCVPSENRKSSDNSSLKEVMVKTTVAIEEERAREDDLVQTSEAADKEAESYAEEVVIASVAVEEERNFHKHLRLNNN